MRWRLSPVLFLIWLAAAAAADAPWECRWADVPPVLDGRADEPVWQRALVVERFVQAWKPGAPAAREGTRVRLLWDREWLYFFAEMDDADVAAEVREHDGPMWENDVFEIFLKPSESHAGYYEFEVNPFGAIVDAFFPQADSRLDRAQLRRGEFHVEARVVVRGTLNQPGDRDTGWSVEGRIPWSDFGAAGGRPAPDEVWRANLSRVNGASREQELSSAAPLGRPSFHRTEDYVALRFVGPAPVARPAWQNTRLLGAPDAPTGFGTAPAWPALEARSMVALAPAPGGGWLWFVDQASSRSGAMRVGRLPTAGDGAGAEILLEPEEQITSLVFHPRFAENGYVYFGANGPQPRPPRFSRVVRYTVRDGRPDPASRFVVIEWPSDGHNGGGLAFGGDGRLFVTSGDGTSDSDRDRVGQDPGSMRAKILRIDVDHPAPGRGYSVPPDNPFVGDTRFVPETWAYGLRNPWRLTYDAASGQLWVGENGQDAWEFAHLVQRGANYGWSVNEGSHRFQPGRTPGPHPFTKPTIEFPHAEFRSLSGGVVYRGRRFPELAGAYVFGDFGTGRIWAAKHDGQRLEWSRELVDTPLAITQVTADAEGEILISDYGTSRGNAAVRGGIHRLERAAAAAPRGEFPRRLSETGIFARTATQEPAPGVLPYEVNVPGWHDGAELRHFLAVPAGGRLEMIANKEWEPPDATVLAQTLSVGGRRIETRLLVKLQGDWAGYTYRWDAAQAEATLVEKGGADVELAGGQPWRIPSRAECMMCHTREANFSLSLNEGQLNRGDQLARWEAMGLLRRETGRGDGARRFGDGGRRGGGRALPDQRRPVTSSTLLPRNPEHLNRYAAPGDSAEPLARRARTYLAVNCAHCHCVSGGGNSAMNFEWNVTDDRMQAIGEKPQHGDFGLPDARVIAPGAAGRSVIVPRLGVRGTGQMPPIVSRAGDAEGLRLIAEWIQSLKE